MAGSAGRETGLEQWSSNNPSIVYRVCCVAWLSIRPSMNELGSSRKCTGGFPCLARIRRHKDFQVSFTCDDLLRPVVVSFPGFTSHYCIVVLCTHATRSGIRFTSTTREQSHLSPCNYTDQSWPAETVMNKISNSRARLSYTNVTLSLL